jgi:hypothetical protein
MMSRTVGRIDWLRANVGRVLLAVLAMAIVVVGVVIRDSQGVAIALVVLGVSIFVLAVILPQVDTFSVGPRGIEARLDRIERKVDQVIAARTVEAKVSIPRPTITTDDPPKENRTGQ